MKNRTFTVLFIENYDPANGVVMTDEQAMREFVDALQDCFDCGHAPGTNFLVVKVEDGEDRFWRKWKRMFRADQRNRQQAL